MLWLAEHKRNSTGPARIVAGLPCRNDGAPPKRAPAFTAPAQVWLLEAVLAAGRSRRAPPRTRFDTQLERSPGLADEFVFVDSEEVVELREQRYGGLADTDRADLVGLDQCDANPAIQRARARRPSSNPLFRRQELRCRAASP
jgi:hypothetical protein